MKKFLSLILVFILIISISACKTEREIKSVKIGDKTYYSLFLYSFKDPEVPEEYLGSFDIPEEVPAKEGYAISTTKDAETIEFWHASTINKKVDTDSYIVSESTGRALYRANIESLIESYPIIIEHKSDTYIITYYTYSDSHSTDTDKDRLIEESLEKTTIEVVKETVVIEYYN